MEPKAENKKKTFNAENTKQRMQISQTRMPLTVDRNSSFFVLLLCGLCVSIF